MPIFGFGFFVGLVLSTVIFVSASTAKENKKLKEKIHKQSIENFDLKHELYDIKNLKTERTND